MDSYQSSQFCHAPSPQQILDTIYPMVHQLIGDPFFDVLSERYCTEFIEYPVDPEQFGDRFGHLLLQQYLTHPELDKLAILPELARLEWLLHDSALSEDHEHLDIHALAALEAQQQADICFHACPSLRMMYSRWPLLNVWLAFHSGKMEQIPLEGGEQWLVIYRPYENDASGVMVEPLTDPMAELLGAILKGYKLSELAKLGVDLNRYLPLIVKKHWLDCFTLDQDQPH